MSIKCGDCGAFIDASGLCECHDPIYEQPVWERSELIRKLGNNACERNDKALKEME